MPAETAQTLEGILESSIHLTLGELCDMVHLGNGTSSVKKKHFFIQSPEWVGRGVVSLIQAYGKFTASFIK